ncbi:uncharacterized protein PGTG_01239 [Puccinia graminis f. sp. tritici CRL 75-36-700-3]|uniref:Uncharacterized protein n=1 Tax=Puccinia graminis f. sp. tritici (strain CRL 75-36-700-3 / race SCCL) TaxID=418459 RepID=E3JV33_PUCGT|nr:uncharacterized protein PGTG_01239 [Puccinia graminis f. sp. tritici CRL 75-36-700-3]EFP75908.1 hypothetical protein PGTG_01239 [Puccinia graminis f. sp. tritici CRL 75-36-700-3]
MSSEQSIWELLDSLEHQLIQSLNQHILPQIIKTSNQLINSLPTQLIPNSLLITSNQQNPIQQTIQQQQPLTKNKRAQLKPTIIIILSSILAIRLIISTTYYQQFIHQHPTLLNYLPSILTPTRKRKPLSRNHHHHHGQEGGPLELIIILGAEPGTLGEQLALHLAQRGMAVIASVSSPEMVARIELEGAGWIKALVLDPQEPHTSIKPFTRSLTVSLGLRFPLAASPNTFINPPATTTTTTANHNSLVGLINCLPLSLPDDLRPIEALDLHSQLLGRFNSLVSTSLDLLKIILPILRNSIEKFGADDGLILTLFPTKNTSLALPYLGSSLIANQALESLMVTLRREIAISDSGSRGKLRIVNERIGTFRGGSIPTNVCTTSRGASLPTHLHPIYARSMARRIGLVGLGTCAILPTSGGPRGSPISQFLRRVERILEGAHGSRGVVGSETCRYILLQNLFPESWVDRWLALVETLNRWIRSRLVAEVDLAESPQTLERFVEKRIPSAQSDWKLSLFSDHHLPQQQQQEEEEQEEGQPRPVEDEEKITAVEQAEELVENDEMVSVDETGSVVDKGETIGLDGCPSDLPDRSNPGSADEADELHDPSLKDSFVGSEIDWKEKA